MNYLQAVKRVNELVKENQTLSSFLDGYKAFKEDNNVSTGDPVFDNMELVKKKRAVYNKITSVMVKIDNNQTEITNLNENFIKPFSVNKQKLNGCKVHAIINAKGGVGKSTITANLSYVLAQMGYKVLAIDCDSQGSLTQLLNIFNEKDEETILNLSDLFNDMMEREDNHEKATDIETIREVIIRPEYSNDYDGLGRSVPLEENKEFGFDLIPADIQLARTEINLSRRKTGLVFLYRIIREIIKNEDYDFILIDCPPALTTLAYNGIGAGIDGCIVPINLSMMVLRATRNLIYGVKETQEYLKSKALTNHKGILGFVKNEYTKNRKINATLEEVVNRFFPIPSFKTLIPVRSACGTAEWDGTLFAQVPSIEREGFWYSLCDEIISEDIRRSEETDTAPVEIERDGDVK